LVHLTLSDSQTGRRPFYDVGGATSAHPGLPPITQTAFSACRAQYPGGLDQVHLLVSSLPMQPSPSHRRVGVHD